MAQIRLIYLQVIQPSNREINENRWKFYALLKGLNTIFITFTLFLQNMDKKFGA